MHGAVRRRIGWRAALAGALLAALVGCTDGAERAQPTTEASSAETAALNISRFTFRDVNVNGIFDLGDRPMADIAVELVRPDGSVRSTTSNVSGFANFEMLAADSNADLSAAGEYTFIAAVPQGWRVTTDNLGQGRTFRLLQGSPAGLVTDDPSEPVGFAPELTIEGVLAEGVPGTDLRAIGPDGEVEVEVDGEGHFRVPAVPGPWSVQAGDSPPREVVVASVPVNLGTLGGGSGQAAALPQTVTATFDDLIDSGEVAEIPSGYVGLGWRNWVVTHNRTYAGGGYINATTSGEYVAYNSSGHPVLLTSEEPFDLAGVSLGQAWLEAEQQRVEVRAWRGDELAYTDELALSARGPVYFAAEYRSVTRIEFTAELFWQFVADDLTIRTANDE